MSSQKVTPRPVLRQQKQQRSSTRQQMLATLYLQFWGYVLPFVLVVVAIGYGGTGEVNSVDLRSLHAVAMLLMVLIGSLLIYGAWTKGLPETELLYHDVKHPKWVSYLFGGFCVLAIVVGGWICLDLPLSDNRVQQHTDFGVLTLVLVAVALYLHHRARRHYHVGRHETAADAPPAEQQVANH